MKINITKKQYETLIKAIDAGSTIYGILGDDVSDEYKKESNQIEELENYFFEFAKDFGMENITGKFEGKIIMNDQYAEKLYEVVNDYNNATFWHELETRFGQREFHRTITKEEIIEMKKNNWYPKRVWDLYEKWGKEFKKNGIEKLEIKE